MTADEYLKTYIETGHFNFGTPRSFTIVPGGKSVLFLRAETGTSAVHKLYELDIASGKEVCLLDLATFKDHKNEELTPAELQMRERLRESAEGISHYSTDKAVDQILVLHGSLALVYNRARKRVKTIDLKSGAHSAQFSPDGQKIAYVSGDAVWCIDLKTKQREQITPTQEGINWGIAEFTAAEEMSRYSGMWWSPKSNRLLIARVDERMVDLHYISNPDQSKESPLEMRYPMAGTNNADVELLVFNLNSKKQHQVKWDRKKYEYLKSVSWNEEGVTIKVISRSQKQAEVIFYKSPGLEPTKTIKLSSAQRLKTHPEVITWWQKRLLTVGFVNGVRCLLSEGKPITKDLNVQDLAGASETDLYFLANHPDTPEERHVFKLDSDETVSQITEGEEYSSAVYEHGVMVVHKHSATSLSKVTQIWDLTTDKKIVVRSKVAEPKLSTTTQLHKLGKTKLASAILLPKNYKKLKKIPVIMSPYGGPLHQQVIFAGACFAQDLWFVQHGYAVIICDGRGTPNRTEEWERSVQGDLARPVLEDQVTALKEATKLYPMLDLNNVGIRGWSFGGYLATLALLERPDVFSAAVAGAPVTDWRLYDTFYSEQFLGHPNKNKKAYDETSLLNKASKLNKPLMLIHGLADDNVLVENTLQLADAILRDGKARFSHTMLLSNYTHMQSNIDTTTAIMNNELSFFNEQLK